MKTRRITIALPHPLYDRLCELAEREMREPRWQATVLVADGLEREGIFERIPVRPGDDGGRAEVAAR